MLVFIHSHAVVQLAIVFDSLESLFWKEVNVGVTVYRESSLIEILGGVATMAQKMHHKRGVGIVTAEAHKDI
jgi:hypothetical protein